MNRRHLLLVAPVVGLAGCTSLAESAAGLSPGAKATVHLDAGKALALAYAGLDGAIGWVEAAIKSGFLHGLNEQTAGAHLSKAKSVLDTADAAYAALSSNDPTSAITTVADLIASVRILTGK